MEDNRILSLVRNSLRHVLRHAKSQGEDIDSLKSLVESMLPQSLKKIDGDQIALINLLKRLSVIKSLLLIFEKDQKERINPTNL